MIYDPQIFFLSFFMGCVFLFLLYRGMTMHSNTRLNRRLQQVGGAEIEKKGKKSKKGESVSILKKGSVAASKEENWMNVIGIDRNTLQQKLYQANSNLDVVEFFIIQMMMAVVVAAVLYFLAKMSLLPAFAIGAGVALVVPKAVLNSKISKRVKAFEIVFPDALDLIVRGLKASLPVIECIANVAETVPDPVGQEFKRIRHDVIFGMTVQDAVKRVVERIPTQEYSFFAIAVSIQAETGGNLGETLDGISKILRDRQNISRLITSKSASGKMSARVIGFMPYGVFSVLYFVAPEYVGVLFHDEGAFNILIGCVLWTFLGFYFMRKMTRFDF